MTSTNYNNSSNYNNNSGTAQAIQDANLERKVKNIELSLKRDKSQANVIAQFANVIEIEGFDKMSRVIGIIRSMCEGWRKIMKEEKEFAKVVGHTPMNNLKQLRYEYFSLLLKTKGVIVGMMKDSEFRKENCDDALEVVNKVLSEGVGELSKGERSSYEESIQGLIEWIDQSELEEIAGEWHALCEKLTIQKSYFEQILTEFAQTIAKQVKKKNYYWIRSSLKCFSGAMKQVIGLGAALCMTVLTVAGAVTAGIAVGRIIGALRSSASVSKNMAMRVGQITCVLDKYIKTCNLMQHKLNNMQITANRGMKKEAKNIFATSSCKKMARGLKKICEYLDTYMEQGNELVSVIDDACEEFL